MRLLANALQRQVEKASEKPPISELADQVLLKSNAVGPTKRLNMRKGEGKMSFLPVGTNNSDIYRTLRESLVKP